MNNDIRRKPEGALLRTYLSAAGVSPDSFEKPLIGVATVSSQVFSEKPDARDLGTAAISGIEAAGGMAVRWDTLRSPDLMTWGHADSYSFAWRDQLADFVESWAKQQALDGLVLVGDAPETLVGMAMAAARLNMPAILVTTGIHRWEYTSSAEGEGGKKKEFADPFELLAEALFAKKKGENTRPQIEQLSRCLLTSTDHSAYAVDLAMEAMGLCLPGMATAPAQSPRRHELAYASGQRVINLVKTGSRVRRVLTFNAFMNAIRLNAALGGSVDVPVHLMALAHESGVSIALDMFDRVSSQTPQVSFLGGVGAKEPHRIEDLDKAGGVWAVFHAMKTNVSPTPTLCGKGAMELAKTTQIKDTHVIAAHRVIRKQSGVGVLRGNLAPFGAVYLLNQVLPELRHLTGAIHVFEDEIEAAQAVNQGDIKKGSILVVRGQGPKGGPGLRKFRVLPALMENRGLNKTVPLVTDGRLPDTPAGLFVSLVSPEGVSKGPLGVVKTGDQVEIDVDRKHLGVRLTDTELRIRLARWQNPEPKAQQGFLGRYSRMVSEVNEGAILK